MHYASVAGSNPALSTWCIVHKGDMDEKANKQGTFWLLEIIIVLRKQCTVSSSCSSTVTQ